MIPIKRLPDYYDTMYQDGYKPWEILRAAKEQILRQADDRQEKPVIHIQSEVKVKR